VETAELNGMTPMWVYPSDRFTEVTASGGEINKRLYLMFLDDNVWGAVIPPETWIDWGNIMYLALDLESATGIEDPSLQPVPQALLKPNYPNPFTGSTTLAAEIPYPTKDAIWQIAIHNVRGQKVCTLDLDPASPSGQSLVWDGKDQQGRPCPSGIYLTSLRVNGRAVSTRKVSLLK
jgi:hypothetical protein